MAFVPGYTPEPCDHDGCETPAAFAAASFPKPNLPLTLACPDHLGELLDDEQAEWRIRRLPGR